MSWDLDGYNHSAHLSAGDLTVLDGLSEFSIHGWCYLIQNTTDRHLFGKDDDSSSWIRLFYEKSAVNGKVNVPKAFMQFDSSTIRAEGNTDNMFTPNEWHSFGMRWKKNDASGLGVIFNGVVEQSESTTTHTSDSPNIAADFYVGRRSGGTSSSWDGPLGEFAAWDEWLEEWEWKALYAGVPAFLVRPWALVFWSPMRKATANEWYYLPKAGTVADFTHLYVDYSTNEYYPWMDVSRVHDGPAGGVTETWGPFTRVKQGVTESFWRDDTVVNGETYKYKLKARDTSDNESDFSSESTSVTPTGGISGDPLPPRLITGAENARRVRAQRAQRMFGG